MFTNAIVESGFTPTHIVLHRWDKMTFRLTAWAHIQGYKVEIMPEDYAHLYEEVDAVVVVRRGKNATICQQVIAGATQHKKKIHIHEITHKKRNPSSSYGTIRR